MKLRFALLDEKTVTSIQFIHVKLRWCSKKEEITLEVRIEVQEMDSIFNSFPLI